MTCELHVGVALPRSLQQPVTVVQQRLHVRRGGQNSCTVKQQSGQPIKPVAERSVVAWGLAATAGFVVAVAYVQLHNVEVGPMTGNTVAAGVRVAGHGETAKVVARLSALGAFLLGTTVGVVGVEESARRGFERVFAATLFAEVVLLGSFLVWGVHLTHSGSVRVGTTWYAGALATLPAFAMGLQTAVLRRVDGQTVRTAFLSGMLTRSVELGVRLVYWRRDVRHGATRAPWPHAPSTRRLVLLAGIVVAYGVGIVVGALLEQRWHSFSLVVPVAVLVTIAIADVVSGGLPPSR
jgi:uncharacterized membrane protein YoaK (UPF0700 family)